MAEKWFVSRQLYWPDGDTVVEIAKGGLDYANADMLSDENNRIYGKLGCDQEYKDPREALEAAIKIRDEWLVQSPRSDIRIEHGFTGGNTMPFTSYPTDEELKEWAEKEWQSLEKCAYCGKVLPDMYYHLLYDDPDIKYCSEYCADEVSDAMDAQNELDAMEYNEEDSDA